MRISILLLIFFCKDLFANEYKYSLFYGKGIVYLGSPGVLGKSRFLKPDNMHPFFQNNYGINANLKKSQIEIKLSTFNYLLDFRKFSDTILYYDSPNIGYQLPPGSLFSFAFRKYQVNYNRTCIKRKRSQYYLGLGINNTFIGKSTYAFSYVYSNPLGIYAEMQLDEPIAQMVNFQLNTKLILNVTKRVNATLASDLNYSYKNPKGTFVYSNLNIGYNFGKR